MLTTLLQMEILKVLGILILLMQNSYKIKNLLWSKLWSSLNLYLKDEMIVFKDNLCFLILKITLLLFQ